MNGLGPGQDGIGTIYGRGGETQCVADCRAFPFGRRWEREERELGNSIDFDDGCHCINRPGVTKT